MLLAVVPLLGWWTYGLLDLDEGFYGAVTAEMNRRGEWLIPYYNGHPWFEKPILLYWAAKPCLAAFGIWVGPRLPSILATIGVYALTLNFGRRHLSKASSTMALIVLSSSLLFVGVGRMMMTDPLLVLCLAGAMFSFWNSLTLDPKWRVLTAFWLGLSVLAKGPVGLALFSISIAVCAWRAPELRPRFRGYWLVGTAVLVATISTWYVPAYLADRQQFVQQFLIEQNLHRFTGGDRAHQVGFPVGLIFYFPVILVGMMPWSGLVLKAWPRSPDFDVRRYLAIWAVVVFAFFTASGAKLVHYVLPCFVPLAVLVGDWLANLPEVSTRRWRSFGIAWTLLVAVVANVAFIAYYRRSVGNLHRLAAYAEAQGGEAAVFRMSRQDGSAPAISTTQQETSHPSVLLYLNRNVLDTDDFTALLDANRPLWILTRDGRITDVDRVIAHASGANLDEVQIAENVGEYRLWKLASAQRH